MPNVSVESHGDNVMQTITRYGVRYGQMKQLGRIADDAVHQAITDLCLDKEGAQRVIAQGGNFAKAVQHSLRTILSSMTVSQAFEGEEGLLTMTAVYPKDFWVTSLEEQINTLRKHFPRLTFTDTPKLGMFPANSEGWFAIPHWSKISATYNGALSIVLDKLASFREGGLHVELKGKLGPDYVRQSARTVAFMELLENDQKQNDILIIPAQFGLLHRGRSTRRARKVYAANEFGLDAYTVGCMLLTHPTRFSDYDDLCILCSGDEYVRGGDGGEGVPTFGMSNDQLVFDCGWDDDVSDSFGAATGFDPHP